MPLVKSALIEDQATGMFTERYTFKRADGKIANLDIAPSETSRWQNVANRLRDLNADPSLCSKTAISEAVSSSPDRNITYAATTGWTQSFDSFVLQDRHISSTLSNVVGISPAQTLLSNEAIKRKGSLDAWNETVGTTASDSSVMMFAIAAAFAAPLLRLTDESSFCVNLFGPTRSGKTAATLAASSVAGVGEGDQLLNWNASPAGLEPAFPSHNDCLLPIDDLNKMRATSERDKYAQIRNVAYTLVTGSSRRRHRSFESPLATGVQVRIISITSSEEALSKLAARCGEDRGGGAIRMIDVPACYRGMPHVFDRIRRAQPTQRELQDRYRQLLNGCKENHGQAIDRYIRCLIRNRKGLATRLQQLRNEFMGAVAGPEDSELLSDLQRKFGLIYAAGILAIEYVDLCWDEDEFLDASKRCYSGAADHVHIERVLVNEGMTALTVALSKLPETSILLNFNEVSGFFRKHNNVAITLIKVEAFNAIFDSVRQRELVLARLLAEGQIERSGRQSSGQARPKEQFIWTDGQRRRSYRITRPLSVVEPQSR